MRKVIFTIIFTLTVLVPVYADGTMEFEVCDIEGTSIEKTFTKATVNVSGIDTSGTYLYYGVDIGVLKKPLSGTEWTSVFQKRVQTTSSAIQITDFGDIENYKKGEIYTIGYRVLYTIPGMDEGSVVETEWKRVEGGCFKLKAPQEIEAQPSITFKDLNQSHWAYEAVSYLSDKKVISGYADGSFKPNAKVTREQFAKMIVLALNIPISEPKAPTFRDMLKTHWSYKYVETVKKYLPGYTDSKGKYFNGSKNALREDIAFALVTAKGYKSKDVDTKRLKNLFKDGGTISKNRAEAVFTAYDKKLINGYADGTFKPKGGITRAEAAMLIYRAVRY